MLSRGAGEAVTLSALPASEDAGPQSREKSPVWTRGGEGGRELLQCWGETAQRPIIKISQEYPRLKQPVKMSIAVMAPKPREVVDSSCHTAHTPQPFAK